MFGNSQLDKLFAAQFSGEGAEIIYRKNSRGAPIRVSAAERDAFIAGFRRASRWGVALMVLGTLVVIGVVLTAAFASNAEFPAFRLYVGLGLVIAATMGLQFWAWRAPERTLRYRMTAGQPLSREEINRAFFERLTYTQLVAMPVIGGLFLLNFSRRNDVLHGWGRVWLALVAAFVLLAVVQGVRKWRYEAAKKLR